MYKTQYLKVWKSISKITTVFYGLQQQMIRLILKQDLKYKNPFIALIFDIWEPGSLL